MSGRVRVFLLILSDALCFYGVWTFVVWGYWAIGIANYHPFGFGHYCALWPIGLVFIAVNAVFRLYHGHVFYPAAPLSPVEELRRLVGSSFITHVGLLGYVVMVHRTSADYSRFVISASGILTAVLVQSLRDLFRWLLHRLDIGRIPVVLAGEGHAAENLVRSLEQDAYVGFRIVAHLGLSSASLIDAGKRFGANILVVCQNIQSSGMELQKLTTWYRHIEYLLPVGTLPVADSHAVIFNGIAGIEMANQRRMKLLRIQKWLLDRILAVVAMCVLWPFFIFVPILIKATSRGPVFYRQYRLGEHGRLFRVWKFRSMYVDAEERLNRILATDPVLSDEWMKNHKLAKDPRVTSLGRFLRKTSLDELPQLFNVFGGTMALVGPRPIVHDEVKYYGSSYDVFSSVKPGITGLWQVSGRSDVNYERRVALDTQYVLNWSPWLDVWILIRTLYAVLLMRGSY